MNKTIGNASAKSVVNANKLKSLFKVVNAEDVVAILINADPDAMASAFALKRLFWRKVKKVDIVGINKIESSELTQKNIPDFKAAMGKLAFINQTAFVHMGKVDNADTLVILADFFMKMAEATWSIVSGVSDKKLVIIYRNAGFRRNAGKLAKMMFGNHGSAGGHKSTARAEIEINNLDLNSKKQADIERYVLKRIKQARQDLI